MNRKWNFGAGPAMLPECVLRQAGEQMLDWRGAGLSVLEMSHRSSEFLAIRDDVERRLRRLLNVPGNYQILLLQGGATGQNAMIPMNLIGHSGRADFVITGHWSKRSALEAAKYGGVQIAASSEQGGFLCIPPEREWSLDSDAAYLHYCSNETIGGVQFHAAPEPGNVPLVADMSSEFLSRPIDVSNYGVIYAGAQKNAGTAGLTFVLIREDLLGRALPITPVAFDFRKQSDTHSLYHTPPTYAIYIAGLMLAHLESEGGVARAEEKNRNKARRLYECIDASSLFYNPVAACHRSVMNVPFWIRDESLQQSFLDGAEQRGMIGLKGHQSVGGMRASLYNSMPPEGVEHLVSYIEAFDKGLE